MKMSGADPIVIASLAGSIGIMGLAMAPFALTGGLAALSVGSLADGLIKLSTVNAEKLINVAAAMEKINAATPTLGQSFRAGVAGLVSRIAGDSSSVDSAAPAASTFGEPSSDAKLITDELKRLNTVSAEVLRGMKESIEQLKRNVDATRALNKNMFPAP